MDLEAKKLIYDIDQAVGLIVAFTAGKRLGDYSSAVTGADQ